MRSGAEPVGRALAEPDFVFGRRADRAPVLQRQLAIERISAVHRLQPDRDRLLARARHRLHAIAARQLAIFGQRGAFLGRAIDARLSKYSAEDLLVRNLLGIVEVRRY